MLVHSKRINITLSSELLAEIDKRAKELFISRSAYISTALSQKIQADDLAKSLPDVTKVLNSFADKIESDNKK